MQSMTSQPHTPQSNRVCAGVCSVGSFDLTGRQCGVRRLRSVRFEIRVFLSFIIRPRPSSWYSALSRLERVKEGRQSLLGLP